jgi:hypothetical protein
MSGCRTVYAILQENYVVAWSFYRFLYLVSIKRRFNPLPERFEMVITI